MRPWASITSATFLKPRHYGVGADGIILMERSQVADAKMRMFNSDGSEGKMAAGADVLETARTLVEDLRLAGGES